MVLDFLKDIISQIFKSLIDKIILTSTISLVAVGLFFKKYLTISIYLYQVLILIAIILFIIFIIYTFFVKHKKKGMIIYNDVIVVDKFHHGYKPNDLQFKNKWNIKNNKKYFYVLLLVLPWGGVGQTTFEGFCGPYCSKCNHILYYESYYYFNCLNCEKKYSIPKDFIKDYYDKVFNYFNEEYNNGNLKNLS